MGNSLKLDFSSWDEIYEMLVELGNKIKKSSFEPDLIVGVSRGGWIPARIISDLLENPELANIKVEFYQGIAETKLEPVITQPISVAIEGKEVLVLDDITDTGKSLHLIKTKLVAEGVADIKIATIYFKPWSIIVPDYYIHVTKDWVVFPWERKETIRNIFNEYKKDKRVLDVFKKKLYKSGLEQKIVERFFEEIVTGKK